jgi:amino acid transporter
LGVDLSQLLSGEHWFEPNPGPPTLAYSALAFVFAVVLGAGLYLRFTKDKTFAEHRLKAKTAGRIATVAISVGAVGLIFVVLRYLSVPYLSARFFVYLAIIALVAAVVYYVYFLLRVLPSKLVAYEVQSARKKYMARPSPSSSRSAKKTKRRR